MNVQEQARIWNDRRYCTAIHEASHAILAMSLGKHFDYVEVTSSDTGGLHGLEQNLTPLARARIYLAGPVGEALYLGKNISMQFSSVDDMMQLRGVDTTFLRPEVERVLKRNWDDVTALADKLMQKGRVFYSEVFNN